MIAYWDEIYRRSGYHYGTEPNVFFKTFIDGNQFRGRILMVAEGEGRNAVYAAQKGWEVHAFDISKEAKKKALELARSKNVNIRYDILSFEEFTAKFEFYHVVALIYAHVPRPIRHNFSKKLWESLVVGGKLIMEVFSEKHASRHTFGPQEPDLLYSPHTIIEDFSCFRIEMLEERTVMLQEGVGHRGEADIISLIARK
ncbi:MAG: methyltransferase domain-containing protein [Bacteroidales bacterium]|nr:methyltransferase domain-containing protein [Bacteroidales bacterium]